MTLTTVLIFLFFNYGFNVWALNYKKIHQQIAMMTHVYILFYGDLKILCVFSTNFKILRVALDSGL